MPTIDTDTPSMTKQPFFSRTNLLREGKHILITLIAALLSAFTLHIFVYANGFAPSGVDGIATMVQEKTAINAGLVGLCINLPLLVLAWFRLDKKYVIYTVLYTVLASIGVMVLAELNFPQYVTEYERIVPAIFSGLLMGIRTGMMLRLGFSTGGTDIVSSMLHKKYSYMNIERLISIMCYIIIGCSYFVYKDLGSVLLSIVQMYVFEKGVGVVLSDHRDAIAFHIITKNPENLKKDITEQLKHGATVMHSHGMFTGEASSTIVSIVNRRQIPQFLNILKNHPDAFVYYTEIKGVKGNFRWKKSDAVK